MGSKPMNKANRVRVDYMPGAAALEVLKAARDLYPRSNTQALIDRLVIVGYSALVRANAAAAAAPAPAPTPHPSRARGIGSMLGLACAPTENVRAIR